MTLGSIPSIVNPDIQHKNINTSCEDLKDNSNETDSILLAGRYQKNAKVQRSTLAKFFSKRKVRNLNSLKSAKKDNTDYVLTKLTNCFSEDIDPPNNSYRTKRQKTVKKFRLSSEFKDW
eukprot:CAMPEP_0196996552 /NCGR_PEP_ID=MMETSP1380-20130617/2401_1 /TAXON_ID=5936 /ORGANISM="Euplotes crassus, Strain CT5" /LENGTH=118 /DNA_ID=CAMNT_0042412553 /DNA_START=146 /DNA_END=499 /DNA_ORIENTATION=+